MKFLILTLLLSTVLGGYFNNKHTVFRVDAAPGTSTQSFIPATTTPPPSETKPATPQYPTEWTTTDGQKFSKVKVISIEPDAVTIMHSDGVSVIDLAVLPADLQTLFHYNPHSAELAADKRKDAEENAYQEMNYEHEVTAVLEAGDPATYLTNHYEYTRLIPYKVELDKLKQKMDSDIATVKACVQKLDSERATLDHNDPQAVESFKAEIKQFILFRDSVDEQVIGYNTQVSNFNNELKAQGRIKE